MWHDTELFARCEKIVCVDGKADHPGWDGFKVLEIPRRTSFYCWADALNSGINAASQDIIFYFDSDRVVPKRYFSIALQVLAEREAFVFARKFFCLKQEADVNALRLIRDNPDQYLDCLIPYHRTTNPAILGTGNPFSGGVGFRKSTYQDAGGFDPRFIGWGYIDYDFFMNIHRRNSNMFCPLELTELHQHHAYRVPTREFQLQNIWNLRQYLEKWGLPKEPLEAMRFELKVSDSVYTSVSLEDFIEKQKAADERAPPIYSGVSRNELCPCGSGQRYKRCHGKLA